MSSLYDHANWLMIDHRASPGTDSVPEGKLVELDCYSCAHCMTQVIKNPKRERPRNLCMKCMAITCDWCAAVGECRPVWSQVIDTPGSIISTPGAPARVVPSLLLPNSVR